MRKIRWSFYGFVYVIATPLTVLILTAILEARNSSFPAVATAAIYPLGYLFFVLGPHVFRPGSSESPEAHTEFSKGAEYATFAIFAVSVPVALVTGIVYGDYLIASALVIVALGSTVLPGISSAGSYGYLLIRGVGVSEFFRTSESPIGRETQTTFWLGLSLRKGDLLKRLSGKPELILSIFGAYFLEWGLLSLAGAFPATLFGVSLGVLCPLSTYGAFRTRTSKNERDKLSELLLARTPVSPRMKALRESAK